eukprot:scaffold56925_cov36-Prasinocladus_malaysianus.AAC.1
MRHLVQLEQLREGRPVPAARLVAPLGHNPLAQRHPPPPDLADGQATLRPQRVPRGAREINARLAVDTCCVGLRGWRRRQVQILGRRLVVNGSFGIVA